MGTVRLGSFANGAIVFEADYNDGNRRITKVRCINNGTANARVTLLQPADNTIVAQVTMLAGTTQYNVAGQQVTVDADGGVNIPYSVRMEYPVP